MKSILHVVCSVCDPRIQFTQSDDTLQGMPRFNDISLQAISAPLGAILASHLKTLIGWFGMFSMMAACSFISKYGIYLYAFVRGRPRYILGMSGSGLDFFNITSYPRICLNNYAYTGWKKNDIVARFVFRAKIIFKKTCFLLQLYLKNISA